MDDYERLAKLAKLKRQADNGESISDSINKLRFVAWAVWVLAVGLVVATLWIARVTWVLGTHGDAIEKYDQEILALHKVDVNREVELANMKNDIKNARGEVDKNSKAVGDLQRHVFKFEP